MDLPLPRGSPNSTCNSLACILVPWNGHSCASQFRAVGGSSSAAGIKPQIARIQFALAGINAHINHDLSEAIVATCEATATVPQHSAPQFRDYTSLNTTLDSIIESAKHTLHVRLLGDALPPASHLEDMIAAWSVSAAREAAWNNAEVLWHLHQVPPLDSTLMDTLDGLTTVTNKAILVPVP